MKIALLLFNMPLSKICGSSRFTWQVANQLTLKGHEVVVIANKELGSFSKTRFRLIQVDTPPYGSWANCVTDELSFTKSVFEYTKAVIRAYQEYHFDILHVQHILFSTLIAAIFKDLYGVPCVATCHGTEIYEARGIQKMQPFFAYAKRMDFVSSASEAIIPEIRQIADLHHRKIEISHPGVDTNKFRPNPEYRKDIRRKLKLEEDDFVILFAGRLVVEKGILETPRIFKDLYLRNPKFKLLIVGDGPERKKTEQLLRNFGLSKTAYKFTSFVPQEDMPPYYAAAEVFLMPSLWNEPFATSALEAMASGCIILANDIGGIAKELEMHGFPELICRSKQVSEFVSKIEYFYKNRDEAKAVSVGLVKLAKTNYTWENTTDKVLSIYKKVIKR